MLTAGGGLWGGTSPSVCSGLASLWQDRAWLPAESHRMSFLGISVASCLHPAGQLFQAITPAAGHLLPPCWRAHMLSAWQAGSSLTSLSRHGSSGPAQLGHEGPHQMPQSTWHPKVVHTCVSKARFCGC